MTKLTKAQTKRAYSREATIEDILDIINEAVEARLADELSRQREQIVEELEKTFEGEAYKRYEADIINNVYDWKKKTYDPDSLINSMKSWINQAIQTIKKHD